MSESEETDTWSGSVDSYFSSDSSSMHCPRPRRLMDLIADKLKLMNCVNRENQQPITTALQVALPDCAEEQSRYLHPQRLACLLREKLERLYASTDDEENLSDRSARKVTFPDLSTSSSSLSKSNLNNEQMEVDVHVPSSTSAILMSSSANDAQEKTKEGNLVDMVLTEQKKTILMLNFPEIGKEEAQPKMSKCASANDIGKGTSWSMNNKNREVTLCDTCRNPVSFGERVFEMAKAVQPQPSPEVERIDWDASAQKSTVSILGVAQHFFDVQSQMDEDVVVADIDGNLD